MIVNSYDMSHVPMLTYFYHGPLTRSRIDAEADRLDEFCRSKVADGMVSEPAYRFWREKMKDWKYSWYEKLGA